MSVFFKNATTEIFFHFYAPVSPYASLSFPCSDILPGFQEFGLNVILILQSNSSNICSVKLNCDLELLFLLSGEYHLGYTSEYVSQKSWYAMLHPEDIHEAKEKHMQCGYFVCFL